MHLFGYDAAKIDRLVSITDPLHRTVSFHYDAAGRVDQQTLPDSNIVGAAYDASSNLTSLTPPGKPAHTFGWTSFDAQQTYTPPNVTGDGTRSTAYTFDLDRQLTGVARPDARTVTPAYEPASGRITSLAWSAGTERFGYDAAGRLSDVIAPDGGTLTFERDGALPLSETWGGAVRGSISRTFDNDFHMVTESVNGANTITYGYPFGGDLLTSAGAETIQRDIASGDIVGTALGNVTTARSYNTFGEPAEDSASFGATVLFNAVYDDGGLNPRDALGRLQHLTETVEGVTRGYDYAYDARGRLTGVQVDGVTARSYTWDANGNRLTKTGGGRDTWYVYDAQDRLVCERSTPGNDCASSVTASYAWTANGELARKTDASGTTSYLYDELGNLLHVGLPGGHALDYQIDGANRRIGRTYDGVLTNAWLYRNSLKPVAELDGSGNVVSRFVYGSKGQVPDYIVKGGVTYRVVSDHLGTPRLIVDQATGAVAQRLDVDEWGVVTNDTNPGFQPFGFDGGLFDGATGLVRFGVRDYAATVGRWTAKDPLRFLGGLNFYGYCYDDPVNLRDSFGFDVDVSADPEIMGLYQNALADPVLGPILEAAAENPDVHWTFQAGDLAGKAAFDGPSLAGYTETHLSVGWDVAEACPHPVVTASGFEMNAVTTLDLDAAGPGADRDKMFGHEMGHYVNHIAAVLGPLPSTGNIGAIDDAASEAFATAFGNAYAARRSGQ